MVGRKYPVVYLLDGDAHFLSVAGMIYQLSEVNGNMVCPDMIVVGIINTNRTFDLTPSDPAARPGISIQKTAGGGEAFAAFLQKELIPKIDALYPTSPYRMLIGHSLGGLTAMNMLINHTGVFNAYTIIDPSMWWDHEKLLKQAYSVLKEKKFSGTSVYLGMANTMSAGMDTVQVRHDTTDGTAHIRGIMKLADAFKATPVNGINFKFHYYEEDNHGSVPLITEYDALRFIFSYYRLTKAEETKLFDKTIKADAGAVIAAHFDQISKKMGYLVFPPETMLNQYGYDYLQGKEFDKAYSCFNQNIKYYPNSANVYDSMGDYYSARKDNAQTIAFYLKALKIKEVPETRNKLNKLIGPK